MPAGKNRGPVTPGDRPANSRRDQIQEAVADLAGRLGISPAEIEVVSQEDVTWPDSSLGCPEPGRAYAQVLVPGLRIILASGNSRYAYHAGGNRRPFLCRHPAR